MTRGDFYPQWNYGTKSSHLVNTPENVQWNRSHLSTYRLWMNRDKHNLLRFGLCFGRNRFVVVHTTSLYAHSLLFQHEHAIHCYTYAKPNSQNTSHTKCVSFSVRLQYVHSSGLTSWHNHFSVVNNIPSLRIVVPSRLYLFILYSIFSFNIFFSSASSSSRTQNLINIRLSWLA